MSIQIVVSSYKKVFVSKAVLIVAATLLHCCCVHAQMRFISHRGESRDAPENTLAAFNLALDRGADGFELDVWLTKDKHLVCMHDSTTWRITGNTVNLTVTNATLAELRSLDVGSWKSPAFAGEKIPTLAEALALARDGAVIYVEIKESAASGVIPYIRDAVLAEPKAIPQRIVFISFKADSVTAIRTALPNYRACWIDNFSTYANNATGLVAKLTLMDATGFDGNYNNLAITSGVPAALHAAGFSADVWTVNTAAPALVCNQYGIDSLTSNNSRDMMDNVLSTQIPPEWIDQYPELLDAHGSNYLATGMAKTGKFDARGRDMSVWEDFVAGTCPTNLTDRFRTFLNCQAGIPTLGWEPNLGGARQYTVWGKEHLDDIAWASSTNAATRFFKVSVALP